MDQRGHCTQEDRPGRRKNTKHNTTFHQAPRKKTRVARICGSGTQIWLDPLENWWGDRQWPLKDLHVSEAVRQRGLGPAPRVKSGTCDTCVMCVLNRCALSREGRACTPGSTELPPSLTEWPGTPGTVTFEVFGHIQVHFS